MSVSHNIQVLDEDGLYGKNIDLTWWRGNLKFNSKYETTTHF